MKKYILRFNHFLFHWYYRRAGDHFKQWTFIKSVKLLIDNYQHLQLLMKNEETHNRNLTRDNDQLRNELFQIKMREIASDDQIDSLNNMFGTGIHKTNEN